MKMVAMSKLAQDVMRIHLFEMTKDNPINARKFVKGQLMAAYHKKDDWEEICTSQVETVLRVAALQDYHLT